jgi:3-deoxy-manno-octulosonate cytidylyltransferase (CMP-KDO synthetase)
VYVICIIPARYYSTRFPGKPLAEISGKPLIQWVFEGVRSAKLINKIIIATDDQRIRKAVDHFTGTVGISLMTSKSHPSGMDRVREVAKGFKADVVVNVQGDEPLIKGPIIDALIKEFHKDRTLEIATLAEPIDSSREIFDTHSVKVVTDKKGFALYFSRSPIPFLKAGAAWRRPFIEAIEKTPRLLKNYWKHQGVYAYRKRTLMKIGTLPLSPLEKMEDLEQLRFLEAGMKIKVIRSKHKTIGVDVPGDIRKVKAFLKRRNS